MTSDTIFAAFSHSAEHAAGREALIVPGAALSFAQFRGDALRMAGLIAGRAEGGPVALLSGDARHLLTAFFACAAVGRPALVLDPARPVAESRRLAEVHGVGLFAVEERFTEHFPPGSSLVLGSLPVSAPLADLPAVPAEAEFYWGMTSGTTGEPKLFARSHSSWLESFSAAERAFSFAPASRVLIPGPLSHSLFLYGAVHALCRGHTMIAPGAFRPDRVAAAARDADCAYVVPAMLAEMLDCGLGDTRLRAIFCGGAKLSAELRRRCETHLPRADLIEFYGASETSFISYSSTTAPAPADSVGRPFPGVRIEVRSSDGDPAGHGDEGEIHVASAMLFSRYVDGPPAAEWFTAGDIGFIDAEGCLHLTGRVNRIINSRALKIRPEPIEQALLELPGIVRAAVIALPDGTRGAIAVAAVEFAAGKRLPRRVLSQHCRARLGARFSPQRYYQADAMPLTRSGKIALASLREALMTGGGAFRELR
jgi:long-chain acyl-CoA synthetase